MSEPWKDDVLALSALYLILEKKVELRSKDEEVRQAILLRRMDGGGLVKDYHGRWTATDKGKDALKRAVAAQDLLRQVEIFARVDVARALLPEEIDPNDSRQVRPEAWDPRFAEGNPGFDLRLAVLGWLAETTRQPVSPESTVFLQRLGAGQVRVEEFWRDPGPTFADIEYVVGHSYKIDDLQPGDPAVSRGIMAAVYAAGVVEQKKRDGSACGGCGVPLVLFEQEAAAAKQALSSCPCCARVFPLPESSGMACPNCAADVYEGDRQCGGCGALLDFSLPAGTVATDTEVVTETVWSSPYGYVSYGWLDPWDPWENAAFIGGGLYYDPWL